jgi:hypothetical protein
MKIVEMPFFSLGGYQMLPYCGTCTLQYLPREIITDSGKGPWACGHHGSQVHHSGRPD